MSTNQQAMSRVVRAHLAGRRVLDVHDLDHDLVVLERPDLDVGRGLEPLLVDRECAARPCQCLHFRPLPGRNQKL